MHLVAGHISDTHIIEGPRAQEILAVIEAAAEEFRRAKVDVILYTGDVFDALSSPEERRMFAQVLGFLSEIAPIVIVRGNHDRKLDLSLFSSLKSKWPIVVHERSNALHGPGWVVYTLPWFDKAYLASQVAAEDEDADGLGQKVQAAARSVLAGIRAQALAQEEKIAILGAHILVGGSQVSTGQTLIGTTVEISPHDLADAGCAYVALGHVHKAQAWADGRVAYAGSPWRLNFGEPEDKGCRIVEIDRTAGKTTVVNNFVQLPARRIELVEVDLTSSAARKKFSEDPLSLIKPELSNGCSDSLVRVRYRIDPAHLSSVDPQALEQTVRNLGAFEAKAEAVQVQKARTRSPEVVQAVSLQQKLDAYIKTKGILVEEEQATRLSAKLDAFGGNE